jgi:hypothetical protein
MSIPYPDTPQLDKMQHSAAYSKAIGEFFDWLHAEHHIVFSEEHQHGPECWDGNHMNCVYRDGELAPLWTPLEKFLADYYQIDLKAAEAERKAILDYARQVQQTNQKK